MTDKTRKIDFQRFVDDTKFVWEPFVRKYHEVGYPEVVETIETSDSHKLIKDPVVSIAILAYNKGKYLSQCIESILLQETEYSFEIVIANDVSTDGITDKICLQYQQRYPEKIRVLNGNANVGVMHNAIRAIENCRGKFIACIDADDFYLSKHKIQKQVSYLIAHPEVSVCFCSCYQQLEGYKFARVPITRRTKNKCVEYNKLSKGEHANIILHQWCNTPVCAFFSAEAGLFAIQEIKKLFDLMEWFPSQDFELWYYMALVGKVYYMPEELCVYRTNSSSISNNDQNTIAFARMFGDWSNKLAMIQDAPSVISQESISYVEKEVVNMLAKYVSLTNTQEKLTPYLRELMISMNVNFEHLAGGGAKKRSMKERFRISLPGYICRKLILGILRI